jgi:hypothetical protein
LKAVSTLVARETESLETSDGSEPVFLFSGRKGTEMDRVTFSVDKKETLISLYPPVEKRVGQADP